jgi:hypothetical protein
MQRRLVYRGQLKEGNPLIPCSHIIPDGWEEVLSSLISHHEEILRRDLRRQRKLVIKAKQANLK